MGVALAPRARGRGSFRGLAVPAALAVLLGIAARAGGQEGVDGLLPTPAGADYRGRKVVIDFTQPGTKVTSMSVCCQPGGRERREFHATRSVLVVDGKSSWQYLPDQHVVLKRPSRGEGAEVLRVEQVRRALASYEVRGQAAEPIVGRRSRMLEFVPRQSGSRPRRRVWVDAETGLVLRTEVYGTDNRLAWVSVFEELEYHPVLSTGVFTMRVPAGARVVEAGPDPCLEPEAAERVAGLPLSLPRYLPAGFELQCIRARRQGEYGEIQVVFGDGLSLLSLFSSTSFRDTGEDRMAQRVAVGPWTGRWRDLGLVTGIQWGTRWGHLALLGEISRPELLKVAGSVQPPGEPSGLPAHQ